MWRWHPQEPAHVSTALQDRFATGASSATVDLFEIVELPRQIVGHGRQCTHGGLVRAIAFLRGAAAEGSCANRAACALHDPVIN